MKHLHHCHCGLRGQLQKLHAGQIGLLGSILLIGHLLFHVAECLVLPAILVALHGSEAEAATELSPEEAEQTTFNHSSLRHLDNFHSACTELPESLTESLIITPATP